jgi:hypothetical protein
MLMESAGVVVSIARWVADEPWPGVVEAHLTDADGRVWVFVDKAPIFTNEPLSDASSYPVAGVVRCVIGDRTGEGCVSIDTSVPDGVESVDGRTQFDVSPDTVVV